MGTNFDDGFRVAMAHQQEEHAARKQRNRRDWKKQREEMDAALRSRGWQRTIVLGTMRWVYYKPGSGMRIHLDGNGKHYLEVDGRMRRMPEEARQRILAWSAALP